MQVAMSFYIDMGCTMCMFQTYSQYLTVSIWVPMNLEGVGLTGPEVDYSFHLAPSTA